MSDNKKYYYLKLKESFYSEEDMKLIESMPNGYEYSSFYLKLCLMSLKEEGRLVFKGRIPYNKEMLSTITGHNIDVVKSALDLFRQLELVSILDSGAIFINDIQALVGKGSTEAERKKIYRDRINKEKKTLELPMGQCPDVCPPEKEIELREKEKTNAQIALESEFETFWDSYGKKKDRKKCFVRYKRLKASDRLKITETLPAYVKSTPDPQYRKNPLTYLNGECWNDVVESSPGNNNLQVAYVPPKIKSDAELFGNG